MIPLTPELASAMLDVVRRRNRYARGTVFVSTVLESALYGKPDVAPELPNFIRVRKSQAEKKYPQRQKYVVDGRLHRRRDSDWMGK